MAMEHKAIVFIERAGQPVAAGHLLMIQDGRECMAKFKYERKYLERLDAVAIDPVQLPLTEEPKYTDEDFSLFNGIRDAAPDAWGRELIDFYMLCQEDRSAGEADYLLASRSETRIGALQFGSDIAGPGPVIENGIRRVHLPKIHPHPGTPDRFQYLIDRFDSERMTSGVDVELLDYVAQGSDLGGARPKSTWMKNGHPWVIKFGLRNDRINMAAAEAGCLELCKMAGLAVCDCRIRNIGGHPALALKRFDCEKHVASKYDHGVIRQDGTWISLAALNGNLVRRHMISGLTLLGAHERDLGLYGYADIHDATRRYCTGSDYGEEIYRRMVMNVLCGNTDDHCRNHAFLLNDDDMYEPSPVYDVTPTVSMSSDRNLFFHLGTAGSGRAATLENAVAAAPSLGLVYEQGCAIANDLSEMVARNWRDTLSKRGASRNDIEMLVNSFSEAGKKIAHSPVANRSDDVEPMKFI